MAVADSAWAVKNDNLFSRATINEHAIYATHTG